MLTTTVPTALVPSFATAADNADNPSGQSTFISPDKDLGFAFTIGNEDVNDYFVTMRLKTSRSWGAIGLGSDDMAGALYFVMYLNEKGDNVTLSPRLAYGHYEPYFYPKMKWQHLASSVADGFATFSFRCIECQNWPGANSGKGYLDLNSNSQKSIWALGPRQKLRSNDQTAALRFHESHGVFSIDMARTKGAEDTPALTDKSVDEGITQVEHKTKLWDVNSSMHAALMTLAVLVLFPLGIVLLRVGRWAAWHGINQAVALIVVLAGFGMGITTSFHYNRVSNKSIIKSVALLTCATTTVQKVQLCASNHWSSRRRLPARPIHPRRHAPSRIPPDAFPDQIRQNSCLAG